MQSFIQQFLSNLSFPITTQAWGQFSHGNSYNSDPWNASEVSSSLYQKIYGLKDGVEGNLEVADIYTPHGFEARINGSKGDKKILIPKMRM